MKTFTLAVVLSPVAASCVLAGPAEVPVLFTNVVFTSGSTNVFVAGSIPQLGNWDPRFSVKLANSSGVWRATIGIPEGADFKYKFIRRATSPDSAYGDINNVTKEPGPDRAGSTPPGPPAPYEGKTIFYYSRWSNVSLLYSNTLVGWTNQPMIAVGPGRTNLFAGEQIWRADSINSAGDTNLQFAFYTTIAGTNVYDNAGQPVAGYQSPLDAMVVQDGQIYNYWPPPTVSTSRVLLIPANAAFNPTNGLTARALRVYLPRGYDQNTTKRYPVLYMHDGQNVFIAQYAGCCGCWFSDTNANNLIRFGKMRETIIVGVANSSDRTCEYSPPGCTAGCSTPRGDQYVSWIADRIRPYINANYRTLTDAENTGAIGSSFGGLISAYMALDWSNVFSKIGCFSTAWLCFPSTEFPATKRPVRLYLDSGSPGDGMTGTIEARDWLVGLGYVFNMDLDHVIGFGDQHNEDAWRRRSPRAFTFLFPTSDEPNTVLDSVAPMNITDFGRDGGSNIVTWTSYLKRTYTIQGSTNEEFSSSMNWSNILTTPPEPRFWNYPSIDVPDEFHFLRVRQNTVPNWPN